MVSSFSDRELVISFFSGITVGILLSWLVVWLVLFKVPNAYRQAVKRRRFRRGRRTE